MTLHQHLANFLRGFELRASGKWFFLSLVVGVLVGVVAILFQYLSQLVMQYTLVELAGYSLPEAQGEHLYFQGADQPIITWMIVVIVTLGGLVSGLLVYKLAPEAAGPGTDVVVDAFHNQRGMIRRRVPWVKTIASAITLGTGGSAGREGPISLIGSGIGSWVSDRFHLSDRDRRILLSMGVAAGIGAIFRAPLAASLFAAEILYRDGDLESDVIVPGAMAAIVSYCVYCLSLPKKLWFTPLFGSNLSGTISSPLELIPFTLLAIALVLAGVFYVVSLSTVRNFFQRIPVPLVFRPAIGACCAGLIAVGLYYLLDENRRVFAVLSIGYASLNEALSPDSPLGVRILLVIAFAKVITTALTVSSGGSGGVFGPSMVIGGCLGAAFGKLWHRWFPDVVANPEIYGIVGMAGFFAACAHAPFSTIIMVSEMTGDYRLLLPTMWVSTLCALLCRRWTLYGRQVPTRLESSAHRGDFIVDLLEGIPVRDVFNPNRKIVTVPEGMSLEEIVHLLAKTQQQYFPVVERNGHLVGIFSTDDVRTWLYDETIWKLAVARDVMVTNIVSLTLDDDLNTAMQRFTALNLDELPVLDPENPGVLLGMLRRKDTIAFYNKRLMEYKQSV